MREIFKGRIKWIILIGIFMIGISITLAVILNNPNKKHDSKDNSKFTTDVKEELERDKDLEIEEQKVEDKEDKSIDVVEKETTINNTSKTNDKNSSSTNSKSNNSVSNNKDNTNNNSNKTSITNNSNSNSNSNNTEIPKQDPPTNKPSEDLTKIANPNDFFYSITGGNVEFSTNAGCMKAGEDIAFIDVVDVQYFRCYEVMSKANTIMGYYLNIFCENGNCNNRYKSMINISNYD